MKLKLTTRAKIFAATGTILSLGVFFAMDWMLGHNGAVRLFTKDTNTIGIILAYALLWLLLGFILMRGDKKSSSRQDVGLLYHFIAVVVTSTVSLAVVPFFNQIALADSGGIAFFLGLSLVIHWSISHDKPKGINKKEAFK